MIRLQLINNNKLIIIDYPLKIIENIISTVDIIDTRKREYSKYRARMSFGGKPHFASPTYIRPCCYRWPHTRQLAQNVPGITRKQENGRCCVAR